MTPSRYSVRLTGCSDWLKLFIEQSFPVSKNTIRQCAAITVVIQFWVDAIVRIQEGHVSSRVNTCSSPVLHCEKSQSSPHRMARTTFSPFNLRSRTGCSSWFFNSISLVKPWIIISMSFSNAFWLSLSPFDVTNGCAFAGIKSFIVLRFFMQLPSGCCMRSRLVDSIIRLVEKIGADTNLLTRIDLESLPIIAQKPQNQTPAPPKQQVLETKQDLFTSRQGYTSRAHPTKSHHSYLFTTLPHTYVLTVRSVRSLISFSTL
mmetsp:Transcript_45217/g.72514  ORF Transcript_45217/g.72514 Transcript_45217/m.72514 type:complete len:260 (-) Transcript_45217:39-818(-)